MGRGRLGRRRHDGDLRARDRRAGSRDARDHRVRRRPPHKEDGIAWSPDGHTLAFLSDAGPTAGQQQIYVHRRRGRRPRRGAVTQRQGSARGAAVVARRQAARRALRRRLVAGDRRARRLQTRRRRRRRRGGGAADRDRRSRERGAVREVSPANMFVYDYDWSPDGQAFAAEAVEGSGTNNYWIAQLYVVRADSGKTTSIWKPPLQIAGPRWSPDGKSIAVIHGIMSDEGADRRRHLRRACRPAARRRTSRRISKAPRARSPGAPTAASCFTSTSTASRRWSPSAPPAARARRSGRRRSSGDVRVVRGARGCRGGGRAVVSAGAGGLRRAHRRVDARRRSINARDQAAVGRGRRACTGRATSTRCRAG